MRMQTSKRCLQTLHACRPASADRKASCPLPPLQGQLEDFHRLASSFTQAAAADKAGVLKTAQAKVAAMGAGAAKVRAGQGRATVGWTMPCSWLGDHAVLTAGRP